MTDELVTVPVTEPLPSGFDLNALAAFVRDLAQNLVDEQVVLVKHGLTSGHLATLKELPVFQELFKAQVEEWEAVRNTQNRLAYQAALGLEKALPAIAARMVDPKEPLPGVVSTAKLFAEVARVTGDAKQANAPGEKFTITINLGADTLRYEKSLPTVELPVQPLTERTSENIQIQPLPPPSRE